MFSWSPTRRGTHGWGGAALFACLVYLTLVSCEPQTNGPQGRTASGKAIVPDSTSIQPLVLDEELCSECIDINPMAVLGDAAGPGYVVATDFVVRDSSRRFWVGQYHDMIKVFDQTGKFLRQVGRAGGGPMEFRSPLPIYVDGASRVHVLDPGNSKETVITSAFSLHNEQRMDVAVWGAVPLLDGSGYIVNAVVQTSSGIGLPLHVVKGSQIVASFGRSGDAIVNPSKLLRMMAMDDSGRVYSASYYKYAIDVWRSDGSRVTGYQGPDFSEPGEPRAGLYGEDNPPRSKIVAMNVDDAGKLWLLISMRRDNWRQFMKEVRGPDGKVGLTPIGDNLAPIFRTRIDVVDVAIGTIVGRTEREEYFDAFLGDGSLLEDRYTKDGTPQVAVWKASFKSRTNTQQE